MTNRDSSLRPAAQPAIELSAVSDLLQVPADAQSLLAHGVTVDSRSVQPGDLYFALPGAKTHGAQFATQAIAHGAVAIVTDAGGQRILDTHTVPVLVADNPRELLGTVAARMYRTAETPLDTFAVTGTNGKTTTTFFLRALLASLHRRAGLIGTIEMHDGVAPVPSLLTTPEASQVHSLLARMNENEASAMVMEVSSHALEFGRVNGLVFSVAGFTNLTQDHLDLHGSMDEYFAVKARLFTPAHSRSAVITVDDPWGVKMAEHAQESGLETRTLATLPGTDADFQVQNIVPHGLGNAFELAQPSTGDRIRATVHLPGHFNVANAALALAMVRAQGVSADELQRAVDTSDPFRSAVPGRMEIIAEHPAAVVDFAHNPDAMRQALESITSRTTGKTILVFGATGERDTTKREIMGQVAATYADVVIVTDDDPHGEDPAAIRRDVLDGVNAHPRVAKGLVNVIESAPRQDAIFRAAALANAEDAILVAGRGHETIQDVGGVDIELDDRVQMRAALQKVGFSELIDPAIES